MSTATLGHCNPGAHPDDRTEPPADALASGKGHTDENFPVASFLIAPQHRPAVMAFYGFARAADDVADNASATPSHKLALLDAMRATLEGDSNIDPRALTLRQVQAQRGLSPQHGLDLLEAFRRDVTKTRYADWGELMDYCRYSAAPVGRFVLDVHGESRSTWPANDALCAALQVINHLQDCAKDYRELDRVYIPESELAAAGIGVEALAEDKSSPALRHVLADLAGLTDVLLSQARPLAGQVRDLRLALEIGVIHRLAESLNAGLRSRDPLSERVHHSRPEALGLALTTALAFPFRRLGNRILFQRRTP